MGYVWRPEWGLETLILNGESHSAKCECAGGGGVVCTPKLHFYQHETGGCKMYVAERTFSFSSGVVSGCPISLWELNYSSPRVISNKLNITSHGNLSFSVILKIK